MLIAVGGGLRSGFCRAYPEYRPSYVALVIGQILAVVNLVTHPSSLRASSLPLSAPAA